MRIFIKRYGYEVSNTTMHKYMNKELNLCAVIMHSKPGYKTGKKHKIFDNLLDQNFTVDCKNKVWCTDFTYMRQPNGKFRYNCSIIDLYDRSAVSSVNGDYINTQLAIDTLNKALEQEHYPKVILHSDQGVQFTSWEFVNFCKENNVTQSMSKAGCPYDNAPMERFYNTFKSNFYNVTSFSSVEMMDELTMKYINWYNYVRPHSYNNYLTPMEARYKQIFIEQNVTKKLDQYNFEVGLSEGRYRYYELPNYLPVEENYYDIGLSSHFLLLYTQLGFDFHIKAIGEMLRVCKEVRIFPVVDLDANQADMISDVIDEFTKKYDVELKVTNYQFQKNANKMLVIWKQ